MHNGAPLLEMNLVHQRFHQIDPASRPAKAILWGDGVRHCIAFKSLSLILNCDRNFSVCSATARYPDVLARVFSISMNDGISKCLTQCHFNFDFTPVHLSELCNEAHDLIYGRRKHLNLTWEQLAQLSISSAREENEIVCRSHVFVSHICRQRAICSVLKTWGSSSGITPDLLQSDKCSADLLWSANESIAESLIDSIPKNLNGDGITRFSVFLLHIWGSSLLPLTVDFGQNGNEHFPEGKNEESGAGRRRAGGRYYW